MTYKEIKKEEVVEYDNKNFLQKDFEDNPGCWKLIAILWFFVILLSIFALFSYSGAFR